MTEPNNEPSLPPGRTRASVSCNNCRRQRRKCVLMIGEDSCSSCVQNGLVCVFDQRDERKRPKSTAYIDSLLNHIELLEDRLKGIEGEAPPRQDTTTTQPDTSDTGHSQGPWQQGIRADINISAYGNDELQPPAPEPDNRPAVASMDSTTTTKPRRAITPSNRSSSFSRDSIQSLQDIRSQRRLLLPEGLEIMETLCSNPRSWVPNSQGARQGIRLGPLAGLQQYVSQLEDRQRTLPGGWSLRKRTDRMIEELDPHTHDHLMELFWSHYNSVFDLVDKDLFYRDLKDRGPHYSGFLHLCSLAMGFRFVDIEKANIQRLDLGNGHSTFHTGAKYLFETELECPSEPSTIQGLLILSDLECAVGRDRLGWMYCGIACRFAIKMGLNVESTLRGLSDHEMRLRKRLLRCCLMFDQVWSLYAGLPTVLNFADLPIPPSTTNVTPHTSEHASPPGSAQTDMKELYDAMSSLMELGSKMGRLVANSSAFPDHGYHTDRLLALATLNSELNAWSQRLPPALRLSNENSQNGPVLYFLIHQQFYAIIIQLYRLFTIYEKDSIIDAVGPQHGFGSMDTLQSFSQDLCLTYAMLLIDLLLQQRRRFGTHPFSILAIYAAGVAGIILVLSASSVTDFQKKSAAAQKIQSLVDLLTEWSPCYPPAQSMADVLERLGY